MPPEGQQELDGSVQGVADRIAARRAAGNAPRPAGPAPDGMVDGDLDNDDYRPGQNANLDDEDPPRKARRESPTPEQLRKAALGEDQDDELEEDLDDDGQEEATDDDEEDLDESEDEDEQDAENENQGPELAFESLDELAEILEVDVDDILSKVKISTLVDGEVSQKTLAQVVKGHQLESSFTRKNQVFVEQQKQFEQEQESKRTQIADHFAKATTVLNMAQQQLMADFSNVNWAELENSNPAEWTKKRQQYGERQARLNQVMQGTTAQLQKASEEQAAQAEEARERHLEAQHGMLMAAVPVWKKDEKRRAREGAKVAEYLTTIGYSPAELEDLQDHRLILLGRAALGLTGPSKQKQDLTKKKLATVKKLVRPGNSDVRRNQGKSTASKEAQSAKARLKKTGTTEDLQAALLARKQQRAQAAKRNSRRRRP